MTETQPAAPFAGSGDRNMALVNYGLLFASIFFVGVPGLIAVIIAYSQRDAVAGPIRSHYDFQIRIFWVAFALGIIGTVCGLWAALMGIGQMIAFGTEHFDAWEGIVVDTDDIRLDGGLVLLLTVTIVSWAVMAIWLVAAPALGFIRLASERRIGQGAA